MSKSILQVIQTSSVQKNARKNAKYLRNESILKIGLMQGLQPLQKRHMTSLVSRLTNLHMIGFGPFAAFRGTRWAMLMSLIELDVTAQGLKMRTQRLFVCIYKALRSCFSNLGHTHHFIKAVTVLDQISNFNSHFVDRRAKKVKQFTKCIQILLGRYVKTFQIAILGSNKFQRFFHFRAVYGRPTKVYETLMRMRSVQFHPSFPLVLFLKGFGIRI